MRVTAGDITLSIIGPGDAPTSKPGELGRAWSAMDRVLRLINPELPSLETHGDGVDTWEVAAFYGHHEPALIGEWLRYLMPPPLSTEEWAIYGYVPTQVILDFVEARGGDGGEFRAWVEQTGGV